jgi:hypothetical protein
MKKGQGISLVVNMVTGKESVRANAFCEPNWGDQTRRYMSSIVALTDAAWAKIIKAAQPYVRAERTGGRLVIQVPEEEVENDMRALMVNLSDVEDNGGN